MEVYAFYLVLRDEGWSPSVKHQTMESAKEEATRLAQEHPGTKFHVLGLMGTAMKQEIVFIESNIVNQFIPF